MLKTALLAMSILLVGCSQTAPDRIRYYMFDAPPAPLVRKAEDTSHLLRINPVNLRGALNNRGILMRLSAERIHAANYHHWSEAPSVLLTASSAQQLLVRLDTWMVVESSALVTDKIQQNYYQLDIELQRFNGGPDNDAELAGVWRLSHFSPTEGQKIIRLQSFNHVVGLQKNGYEGLVDALSAAWLGLNGEIADAIAALPPTR